MYYTFILLYCAICASQDNEPSTYDTYTFTLKNKVGNFKKYNIKKMMAELEIILSFCNYYKNYPTNLFTTAILYIDKYL